MDLKTLLGDKYKDGMSIEDVEEALKGINLVDPDSIPKGVSKEVFDKTAAELARYKRELKELREANMTAEEKLSAELKKAQELQLRYAREFSALRAKEVFVNAGLTEDEYNSIIEFVVSDDEETTISRAKAVVALVESQRKATEKAVKADLMKDAPRPKQGKSPGGITKEEFSKLSLLEKQRFAKEFPEVYQSFYKEE